MFTGVEQTQFQFGESVFCLPPKSVRVFLPLCQFPGQKPTFQFLSPPPSPPTLNDHSSLKTCAVSFTVCQEITLRLQKEVFILSLIDAVSLLLLIVFLSSSSHIFDCFSFFFKSHFHLSDGQNQIPTDSFTGSPCMI